MTGGGLADLLRRAASDVPERQMVGDASGRSLTYAGFDRLSDRVAAALAARGVSRGDRVGVVLPKSIDSLAALFGALKLGAAYVPLDATAPRERTAALLADCQVRAAFVEASIREELAAALERRRVAPELVALSGVGGGRGLEPLLVEAPPPRVESHPDDLAYILYTSGSTGRPKGVMLTHGNARAFVDWCCETLAPEPDDRFSSHAPFHFDLSILDLFVPIAAHASSVLIDERTARVPASLAALIERQRLTVWYSTPTTLRLLVEHGDLGGRALGALRLVLFAGEVFPVEPLRRLKELLPHPTYYNLYGPTETNVCTYFELPATVPASRQRPYPIGRPASGARIRVVDERGDDVEPGAEGELWVHGPSVMRGYWRRPRLTAEVLRPDAAGRIWYRTGDRVEEAPAGGYQFVGRRDRMVKRRGYRIELGEIEAALYRDQAVREAAVVARPDDDGETRIRAFVRVAGDSASAVRLKGFLSRQLPLYMMPDRITFLEELPKTSTDKIDYRKLVEVA